jgi:hypothetical protein
MRAEAASSLARGAGVISRKEKEEKRGVSKDNRNPEQKNWGDSVIATRRIDALGLACLC